MGVRTGRPAYGSAGRSVAANAQRGGRGYKTEYYAYGSTVMARQPRGTGPMGQGSPEYYTDGNTVRVRQAEAAEPVRQRRPEERHRQARRADRVAIGMAKESVSLPLTVLLVAAVAVVLILGARYLTLKSSIDMHMDMVKSLETQLEQLRTENDALERSIDTSVDLNHVYDEAVGRLGMVRAGRDNIITFNKTESEYVRQYDEIPSE